MNGHGQVVKKAGAKLQMRVVQPALVEHWSQRVRSLARDISRINEVSLFEQQPTAVHTSHRDALQMYAHERAQAAAADMKGAGIPLITTCFPSRSGATCWDVSIGCLEGLLSAAGGEGRDGAQEGGDGGGQG